MQENKNWQRLEAVLRWANMSANYFAHHIGLSRGENLYQIKRGNNGISLNLAERIVTHFPQINRLWLLTGEGEMLLDEALARGSVPFYRLDAELAVRKIDTVQPECMISLPVVASCDLAMLYMGTAMGRQLPVGTIVFLKQVGVEHLIPGKEYLVCSRQFDALRLVRTTTEAGLLRLVAGDRKNFDDLTIRVEEIEKLYSVCAKLTIQ
ncbi:MAG: hypothetical protein IKY68_04460 [Alistipes sp.]|nr:hypothetical protein [Alistipes sp.]